MEQPWRVGLAVTVIVALVGAIIWFGSSSGDDSPTVAPTSVATTASAAGGDGSSMTASTPTTATTAPTATTASTATTAVDGSTSTTVASSAEAIVLEATDRALAAWGEFAVTGDLALATGLFVVHGPQLEQLRGEAAALLADPLGPPPYLFEVRDPEVTMEDPGEAIVAAQVVMTRTGETPQEFDWRIHLHQIGGAWQLWTVEVVE